MASKILQFGDEARESLIRGLDKLANAVKETMGPRGRNVVIEKSFGAPYITKDGVSVAKEIDLSDPFENMGAQMVKDVASRTGDDVGDGTTTSTVLSQSIAQKGFELLKEGVSPVELKRGMDKAVDEIVKVLRDMAKEVSTEEEVSQVGTISANNEKEIGDLIAEALDKVGMDGVISVEESSSSETFLTEEEGFRFEKGFTSPMFLPPNENSVTYKDCLILVVDSDITNVQEYLSILRQVAETNKPLLIISNSITGPAHDSVITNHRNGVIKCVCVNAPSFGENKSNILMDIATATGAKVVGTKTGLIDPKGANSDPKFIDKIIGKASQVTVSKSSTIIKGGAGSAEDIQERVESLAKQAESTESAFDKEKIQERIGSLTGGMAVIHVGGYSEVEIKEKRDRVDDALCATRAAVAGGIVPGGGTALLLAAKEISKDEPSKEVYTSEDQIKGRNLIIQAVEAPARQIVYNSGLDPEEVISTIKKRGLGFDSHTGKYCDLVQAGVIDPVNVTVSALTNAASVSGMLLTTSCSIVTEKSDNPFEGLNIPTM
jgi:chaperonin GroEL